MAMPDVTTVRVPEGGLQPQVTVDERGTLHMVYLNGNPGAADIFYVRSEDGGETFSLPIQVNSTPGSAVAKGTVRGAHLAVGKGGRVHVAWLGSERVPERGHPMLYTRSIEEGGRFEAQRNLMQFTSGLDGGGSVAADRFGNVYVAWHGVAPGEKGESQRRIWITRSSDEGKTFSGEKAAWDEPTGSCACCGMRAFADQSGSLYILYRAAVEEVNRDMYLLVSADRGKTFEGRRVHPWEIRACPMSTAYFAEAPGGVLMAWETRQQVLFSRVSTETSSFSDPVAAPGDGTNRKHPTLAANQRGESILVWTEGAAWARGGSLAWQVYDRTGRPLHGKKGRIEGVPTWSLAAVFARPSGEFVVVY